MVCMLGCFRQINEKSVVFELHTQNPSKSYYIPGDVKVKNVHQRNANTVGTAVKLNPNGKIARIRRLKLFKRNRIELNRVFIMRIDTNCQVAERQSVVEWVLRSQRPSIKAGIVSVINATDKASLLQFVLQCFHTINREIPGTPIVVTVKADVLTTWFGGQIESAKNELARQIAVKNQIGVTDANSIDLNAFDSEPDDQIADTYRMLSNRLTLP